MKVVVIGGVAAGTKAAAKIKREDRSAQVRILTKGHDISYAGCGLPYYIGGMIGERDFLLFAKMGIVDAAANRARPAVRRRRRARPPPP